MAWSPYSGVGPLAVQVLVYEIQSGALATIASDNLGTPLANPFLTNAITGAWTFYATTGLTVYWAYGPPGGVAGNAASQATPSDPTGTTNTTGKMMGLAGAITPLTTGRVVLIASGDLASTLSGDGAKAQLRYGTGTAPTNGAALTGTAVGGLVTMLAAANNQRVPVSLQALVSGLAIATPVWIDVSLAAVTGGTATLQDMSLTAIEV